VRLQAFLHRGLEGLQQRDALAAAEALVGERRVGEAVAQHDVAAAQRRRDHPRDVVAPGREHEQGFAHAVHRPVQNELAQRLGELGAAGSRVQTTLRPAARSASAVGSMWVDLPAPSMPFEGDEPSAHWPCFFW
jgi:hypothetical protein